VSVSVLTRDENKSNSNTKKKHNGKANKEQPKNI